MRSCVRTTTAAACAPRCGVRVASTLRNGPAAAATAARVRAAAASAGGRQSEGGSKIIGRHADRARARVRACGICNRTCTSARSRRRGGRRG